jgi:hypothetical protein
MKIFRGLEQARGGHWNLKLLKGGIWGSVEGFIGFFKTVRFQGVPRLFYKAL